MWFVVNVLALHTHKRRHTHTGIFICMCFCWVLSYLPMGFYFSPFFWLPMSLFYSSLWSHVDYFGDKVECKCWNCNNERGWAHWPAEEDLACCNCLMFVLLGFYFLFLFYFFFCVFCVRILCETFTTFKLLYKLSLQLCQSLLYSFAFTPRNCRISELQLSCSMGRGVVGCCNVNQVNYKVINTYVVGFDVNRDM